jgi:hypothetical protein
MKKNQNRISETCDIVMNEVIMEENNVEEKFEVNPSL